MGLFSNLYRSWYSPIVLLVVIVLAIVLLIFGLLYLLVRPFLRHSNIDPDELENTTLQTQLQQLFQIHDSGVDQSLIDTLPVFTYNSIIGVEAPFDCAVCLCVFEADDNLRLLPKCSHAFHTECIDSWLWSHSTCPLCRACLLQDYSPTPVERVNSQLSNDELSPDLLRESCEGQENLENQQTPVEEVVRVKLGKFKNVNLLGEGSSNTSTIDSRRCFSMGVFSYVMDDNTSFEVPIISKVKKSSRKKNSLPLTPRHKIALSECSWSSRRSLNGFDALMILEENSDNKDVEGINIEERISTMEIWLNEGKERPNTTKVESSRRAFSFRFPLQENVAAEDEMKDKSIRNLERRAVSENGYDGEFGCDEIESCDSFELQLNTPSFARRTLTWLMGDANKEVQSNSSSNV